MVHFAHNLSDSVFQLHPIDANLEIRHQFLQLLCQMGSDCAIVLPGGVELCVKLHFNCSPSSVISEFVNVVLQLLSFLHCHVLSFINIFHIVLSIS